jgi:2-polyprenyl-6-hydroxyphenyl methylase/3-demethylubiquinone-9 3-methyltransferase
MNPVDPQRLTTVGYWDQSWEPAHDGPKRARRLRRLEWLDGQLASLLVDCVRRARSMDAPARVLEAGCANSIWLPFLARETGSDVVGVDFSERGCRLAERNLAAMGVRGSIVRQDFFEFAQSHPRSFDVILSFGLVEHFVDVALVIRSMVTLLRPGGVLFASVPNLAGVYGPLQRAIDERVFRRHVVLTPDALTAHAREAGLTEVASGFVGGTLRLSTLNFGHVNWLPALLSRVLARGLYEADSAVAATLRALGRDRAYPSTAPYVYVSGTSRA